MLLVVFVLIFERGVISLPEFGVFLATFFKSLSVDGGIEVVIEEDIEVVGEVALGVEDGGGEVEAVAGEVEVTRGA